MLCFQIFSFFIGVLFQQNLKEYKMFFPDSHLGEPFTPVTNTFFFFNFSLFIGSFFSSTCSGKFPLNLILPVRLIGFIRAIIAIRATRFLELVGLVGLLGLLGLLELMGLVRL